MKHTKPLIILSLVLLLIAAGTLPAAAAEATDVANKRYQVFMLNPLPGCNPTAITFRPDNILVIGCMDGFGTYLSAGNAFVAVYRAPDFFSGRDLTLFFTGFALDPVLLASGIAYVGDDTQTVLAAGYLLGSL